MKDVLVGFFFIFGSLFFLSGSALAITKVCQIDHRVLSTETYVYKDVSGQLTAQQVRALPAGQFQRLAQDERRSHHSPAVYWLRLILTNNSDNDCWRWLTIGSPHLEDIQLFNFRENKGQVQYAGSKHPLEKWTTGIPQPIFTLVFKKQSRAEIFIRTYSTFPFIIFPQLWSTKSLIQAQQNQNVRDGIVTGVVSVMVILSLAISFVMRSRLLMIQGLGLGSYLVLSALLNGYLVYWPDLLVWYRPILSFFIMTSFIFSTLYLALLLQINLFSRLIWAGYITLAAVYSVSHLWAYFNRPEAAYYFTSLALHALYFMILLNVIVGLATRKKFSGMAWLIVALLTMQFTLRTSHQVKVMPWLIGNDFTGLFPVIPGSALLLLTLFSTVLTNRFQQLKTERELAEQQKREQETLESLVRLRTAQLNESLQQRNILLARVSHDLRSPLIAIMDTIALLNRYVQQDMVNLLKYYAKRQLELIDELLNFARNNLKTIEITPVADYLFAFLAELEKEGGYLSRRKKNRFNCVVSTDLPAVVQADFQRLRQIIINLLDNAAKFTEQGTIIFSVDCLAKSPTSVTMRFSVSDSGIGIPSDDRTKLLQPFERGENATHYMGSGLGLAIVNQLLSCMGSTLHIDESAALGGGYFWFDLTLPVVSEAQIEHFFLESYHSVSLNGDGYRVLVVDDEANSCERIFDLLSGYGFEVLTAPDGESACEILTQKPVELIITDWQMPKMNGCQLLRQVRNSWPETKVILHTAYPENQVTRPRYAAFDAVLLKPVESACLLSSIQTLLNIEVPPGICKIN
jgi:signal transduction histidine kinase/CheY-like chemotaxis protein